LLLPDFQRPRRRVPGLLLTSEVPEFRRAGDILHRGDGVSVCVCGAGRTGPPLSARGFYRLVPGPASVFRAELRTFSQDPLGIVISIFRGPSEGFRMGREASESPRSRIPRYANGPMATASWWSRTEVSRDGAGSTCTRRCCAWVTGQKGTPSSLSLLAFHGVSRDPTPECASDDVPRGLQSRKVSPHHLRVERMGRIAPHTPRRRRRLLTANCGWERE